MSNVYYVGYIAIYSNGASKTISYNEEGVENGWGTSGIIPEGEAPVKVIEGREAVAKYRWCDEWKKLDEKQQNLVFAIYGKDNLREKYKNEILTLKSPNRLVASATTFLYRRGYNKPCTRCGGSGHFSYNLRYGTTCFKCSGKKLQEVNPTKAEINKWLKAYPEGIVLAGAEIKGKGEYLIKEAE